jgi:hypothetical protein
MAVLPELNELLEVSSQIEAAVVFGPAGELEGSTLADEQRSADLVRAARDLLAAAEESGPGRDQLAQLEVSSPEGSVFVARGATLLIAALTGPEPTVGLVFYDLKSCLRNITNARTAEPPAGSTRRRRRKDDDEAS